MIYSLGLLCLLLGIGGIVHQKLWTSGGWFNWQQFWHHESLIMIMFAVGITLIVVKITSRR